MLTSGNKCAFLFFIAFHHSKVLEVEVEVEGEVSIVDYNDH